MMPRVFVDTDVVLDLLLAREPFFRPAAHLFLLFQEEKAQGSVSPLAFSNLFYILRKQMSGAEALAALRKLRLIVRVLPIDDQIIDRALASAFTDFEDAIQYYAALADRADALVTRNKQDYKESKLPVLDAEEYVAQFLTDADA